MIREPAGAGQAFLALAVFVVLAAEAAVPLRVDEGVLAAAFLVARVAGGAGSSTGSSRAALVRRLGAGSEGAGAGLGAASAGAGLLDGLADTGPAPRLAGAGDGRAAGLG